MHKGDPVSEERPEWREREKIRGRNPGMLDLLTEHRRKAAVFPPGTLAESGVQGQDHLGMHKTGGNDLRSCWQTHPVYSDCPITLGKPPFPKKTSMRTHKADAKVCCVSEIMTLGE